MIGIGGAYTVAFASEHQAVFPADFFTFHRDIVYPSDSTVGGASET